MREEQDQHAEYATITSMTTPPVCDYEGSDYQERFWEAGGREYEDMAEELALRKLLPKSGMHLLEIGAGAGRNTPRYKGYERITLLDYSRTQLAKAAAKLGNGQRYRYIAADVYRLPFGPNSFDAATMIRTIHHLSHPETALRNLGAALAGQSPFVLEFANKRNLKSVLRYIAGRQKWNPFSREAVEFVKLNFDFHPASIKDLLVSEGFLIEKQVSVSYLRARLLKRMLPIGVMRALESALQAVFSWSAYSPSVFLLARKKGAAHPLSSTALFRCPACGHYPIEDTPPELTCGSCGRTYTFTDGIYDFRVKDE